MTKSSSSSGLKMDMRVDDSKNCVTIAEGQLLKTKIGASSFVECSAKDNVGLNLVFEEAIRAIEKTKTPGCRVL